MSVHACVDVSALMREGQSKAHTCNVLSRVLCSCLLVFMCVHVGAYVRSESHI